MNEVEYVRMYEAEEIHWWYVALHELILSFVVLECRDKPLNILDVGCGTGRLCQMMSEYGEVSGCDRSGISVAYCRKRNLSSVFRADLNTVVLQSDFYDVITSIDVLCHRAIKDDVTILKKLYTALKPSGILILNLPAYESLRGTHDAAVHTERRYSKSDLVSVMTETGFVVEKATYRLLFLFLPVLIYRLFKRLFLRHGGAKEVLSDVSMPSAVINRALLGLGRIENLFIKRYSMPFGTSVFAVGRKPL
ncbi:MAG: class I SAM-dependent methyltransferase [Nitrospirae bacterium]|nr:MAG: class I SAM-dependent methyltransferase [Nitrospirota bacterium]